MIGKYGKLLEGKTAFELEDGVEVTPEINETDYSDDDIPFV